MRNYFISCFCILFVISCSSKKAQKNKLNTKNETSGHHKKDTIESFQSFNIRFHADSSFQVSRVAFPIGGKYVDGSGQHGWTKQNWKLLKAPVGSPVDTTQYKYRLTRTDSSVSEKFWIDQSDSTLKEDLN